MTQEKLRWRYIHYLASIFIMSVFLSCNKGSDYKVLSDIVSSNYELNINDYKVLVILEENSCIACNKTYAQFVEKSMKDSVLLIVAATGSQYQIDVFRNVAEGKVIFDYSNKIKKANILNYSGAIFIKNNQIDTIVELNNAEELKQKIEYIEKHF